VQAEHEAPLQLAFSHENQDSEDFSTPNCQYIAVPKNIYGQCQTRKQNLQVGKTNTGTNQPNRK